MKNRLTWFVLLFVLLTFSNQLLAKDTWISVKSKNFYLIGNATEKDIRAVGTKLEQFRETFRLLFQQANISSSIPTTVIVFKDKTSYNPFRPKLSNGKPDENIAGYFQPSEDLNYITLSTEGEKADAYGTIFHEYVHFLVETNFGKSEIPPWFNEGLAEYYQTFKIENDQKVTLGDIQNNHLGLLQRNELIPLKDFFEIDNLSLHQNGNHSRSIFYAQAWALMHYLIQGNKDLNKKLGRFMDLLIQKVDAEKAFQEAFQMDYSQMENALRNYVKQSKYNIQIYTFNNKLIFDTQMTTSMLSEAEANAYLGDLLYHTHETEDAEIYLQKALALDANSSLANTSLGLVKMRQRKFDEAKKYLEKAIAIDQKNYSVLFNYAYILIQEEMDEFGFVREFSKEKAVKIEDALNKSIQLNPSFPESYRLLAFVKMVNNESLDDSLALLKKALEYNPGSQELSFLIAQIYMRQQKFVEAKQIVEKISKTTDDPNLKGRAEQLLNIISKNEKQMVDYNARKSEYDKQKQAFEERNKIVRNTAETPLTEADREKIEEENRNLNLNKIIKRPIVGEQQVVGYIMKITCVQGIVNYSIKTATETITLTSKDFQSLELNSYTPEAENAQVGCGATFSDILSVVTFQENKNPKLKTTKGTLLRVTFVPQNFKFLTVEELAQAKPYLIIDEQPEKKTREATLEEKANSEKQRRETLLNSIKESLRKPLDGEVRVLGTLEKVECKDNKIYFVGKSDSQILRLRLNSPKDLKMASFTNEASGLQIGCGKSFPNVLAVITYRPTSKTSLVSADDELVMIEFVPKDFKLD
jgi:tetratricopeptide (TPR) repeat protein